MNNEIEDEKVVDVTSYINDLKITLNVYDELLVRMDRFSNIFKSLSENLTGFNELIIKICSNFHENELNGLGNLTKHLNRLNVHGNYFVDHLSNLEDYFKKGSDQNFAIKLGELRKSLHKLKKEYDDKNHRAKYDYKKAVKRLNGIKKKMTSNNELNDLDYLHKVNDMETKKAYLNNISKSTLRQAVTCERQNLFSFIDHFSGFNKHLICIGESIKSYNETWEQLLVERKNCSTNFHSDRNSHYGLPLQLVQNLENYKTDFSVNSSTSNTSMFTTDSDNNRKSSFYQQSDDEEDRYDENEDSFISTDLDRTILPENPNNFTQDSSIDDSFSPNSSKLPAPPEFEKLYPNQLIPPPSYQNVSNLFEESKKRYGSLFSYTNQENAGLHYDYGNIYYKNGNKENNPNYGNFGGDTKLHDSASTRILKTKPFVDTSESEEQEDTDGKVIPPKSIDRFHRKFSETLLEDKFAHLSSDLNTFGYASIKSIKVDKPLPRSNSMIDTKDVSSSYESIGNTREKFQKLMMRPKLAQKRPVLNDPNSYRHSYADDIQKYLDNTFKY